MKDNDFFANFTFCCHLMEVNITLETNRKKGQVVMYDPITKCYSMNVIKQHNAISPISYCPYCGTQLPKDLRDKHCEIIKKELGEDYLDYFEDGEWYSPKKELPEEFKTDEWWKKRGL